METYGEVLEVKGHLAVITTRRHASCGRCGACGLGTNQDVRVEARNLIGAKPGDRVVIALETNRVLLAALIGYGLPLLFFLIGILAGYWLAGTVWPDTNPSLAGGISGAVLLILSYVLLRAYDRRASESGEYLPRIIGFIND